MMSEVEPRIGVTFRGARTSFCSGAEVPCGACASWAVPAAEVKPRGMRRIRPAQRRGRQSRYGRMTLSKIPQGAHLNFLRHTKRLCTMQGRLGSRHANATVFPIKWAAIIGSFVLVTCLTISPSPYDAARGLSIASVTSPVSNTASKGNCLTSTHPTSARATAQPQRTTARHSGKILVGCETAFSQFADRADFRAARCVT